VGEGVVGLMEEGREIGSRMVALVMKVEGRYERGTVGLRPPKPENIPGSR
jgi:hypothetical protein